MTQATDPLDEKLIVVSADSHVGPRLEDMRPYCPADYLDDYDSFVRSYRDDAASRSDVLSSLDIPEATELAEQFRRVLMTEGHHDMHSRIRDMDRDGIAAEVIFHGSQNNEPMPLIHKDAGLPGAQFSHTDNLERSAVGLRIYNRWLADACSVEPHRHIGAIHLPLWDIDESIRELEWGRQAGLKAANFSAPRPGILPYDSEEWEPFWSACEALELPLLTHGGSVDFEPIMTNGPHFGNLMEIESGGWPVRRALHRMIFGGVFARHPNLKLVFTEQNGAWWTETAKEYDSSYKTHVWQIVHQVPEPPSFYLNQNVFIGASFMAPFEAETAVSEGYWHNVVWGRDYPHVEGTYQYQEDRPELENYTKLSMRYAFSSIDPDKVKAMVGENGIRVYGLDRQKLQEVADRIDAPTLSELSTDIHEIPRGGGILAFRTMGPWG